MRMSDLINRQAAIDALDGEIIVTGRENAEAVRGYANLALDRIKRLPSSQPEADEVARNIATIIENEKDMRVIQKNAEQRWTPWKEHDDRLRDHYYYLVTHKDYGTPMKAWYHKDVDRFDILSVDGGDSAYIWDDKITAWMELPEKYGGEENG